MKQHLFGQPASHRITIYKVEWGFMWLLPYLWKIFSPKSILNHCRRNTFFFHIRNIPLPFAKYLVPYVRRGLPHENGTSTYIRMASSDDEITSFVSYAVAMEEPRHKKLPDITRCNFTGKKNINDFQVKKEREDIKRYIDKGYIRNFKQLSSIHKKCSFIWATPLYDERNKLWGAMVIDSTKSDEFDNDSIEQKVHDFYQCSVTITTLIGS
ncbi:MAG: hypothetical protein D3922_00125 [Candidatus Electrothrix sp. AR1]|nr:hypothetical protein [Candidatus Electrothrix sp. AR1]